MTDRRTFLGTAALSAAAYARAAGAADRVPIALIGCGGMMRSHISTLLGRKDVDLLAVCEVDQKRLGEAAGTIQKARDKAPATEKDLRKVLTREVEAVFIATPDHWHTPAALLALEAGKHVYV